MRDANKEEWTQLEMVECNVTNEHTGDTSIVTTLPGNNNGTRKNKKISFVTKAAVLLTFATTALLLLVTISVHTFQHFNGMYNTSIRTQYTSHSSSYSDKENIIISNDVPRTLQDEDYSEYTCEDIFSETEAQSEERCAFAKTCNSGNGLLFSFVFCDTFNLSTTAWCATLSPILIIWLVVLFRMLGTTAEDFFSPSLEFFSVKMGLPPRFAGVSLLALGNGAADVSATMNAIVQNPQQGYQMSLGALTGAGMFVGTVVAGIVIVIADGVKCRGALIRDLLMLIITIGVVYGYFSTGSIGSQAIAVFLSMYVSFVFVVLIADIYHRVVVLPRIRRENERMEQYEQEQQQLETQQLHQPAFQDDGEIVNGGEEGAKVAVGGAVELTSSSAKATTKDELTSPTALNSIGSTDVASSTKPKHKLTKKEIQKLKSKRNPIAKRMDAFMVAFSNYEKDAGKSNSEEDMTKGWGEWGVDGKDDDRPVPLHGHNGILYRFSRSDEAEQDPSSEQKDDNTREPSSAYIALLDGVQTMCIAEGAVLEDGTSPNADGMSGVELMRSRTWAQVFQEGKKNLVDHVKEEWGDIFDNDEVHEVDKFFVACELPFTVLRKITVPIPCEGYYCHALVALSCALATIWIGVYGIIEKDTNLFFTGGYPYIEIYTLAGIIIGLWFLRYAPQDVEHLSIRAAAPIAFFGFVVAATWIDTIADQLVRLLTLLGVICRIPNSIMGLTVLAWGNSMGDLSANMTMAKKNLANMAITACFAGPIFNIFIGLGGGFAQLNEEQGQDETDVKLTPSIIVGFLFMVINSLLVIVSGVLYKGVIPKGYGYAALTLYVLYVIISIGLQYYPGIDMDYY